MQEVVKNLHLYAPVTVEGRVTNQSGYESSPIVIEAKDPDSIKFSNKIPFKYNDVNQSVSIQDKNYPVKQWVNTPFGILEFLPNKYYYTHPKK